MKKAEIGEIQRQATIDGYCRGVLGIPLDRDDVGKTQDELREKYARILGERGKVPQTCS